MTVGVVGLGAMGAGIVEVFAKAGHRVVGIDRDESAVQRGRGIVESSTERAVTKTKISAQDRQALLDRITFGTDSSLLSKAKLIIEAVSEDPELKQAVFSQIDANAPQDAILATNTSSLSITEIAAKTSRPQSVLGLHFFNPAPVQALVEVIDTVLTDPDKITQALAVITGLGKVPVRCSDRAGFVVNALLFSYLNAAIRVYANGQVGREPLDATMVDDAGYPMGPLLLLDLVGLDVAHAILVRMYEENRDRRYAPDPLLSRLVSAGLLGRKTGRGFYTYRDGVPTDDAGPINTPPWATAAGVADLLVTGYLNEALRMVEINYATPDAVDTAMKLGCRMPEPFVLLTQIGPDTVLQRQQSIFERTAEPGDRPAALLETLADPGAGPVPQLGRDQ